MIHSGELSIIEMAQAAGCNKSTIRMFGSVKAQPIKGGRTCNITQVMVEVLCDHLIDKPALYLDEFVLQETKIGISRALKSKGWSIKTARVKARERNLDLRDEYYHFISDFKSYHLVYIDESGCDKRIGFRRTGWSPLGTAPVQVSKFHRDGQRYHILPAYAQDGIVLSRVCVPRIN